MKVDPKLGDQWNVPSLVANGKRRRSFQCSKANGRKRRSFQCSEANGRRRRNFLFTFFHFPPQATHLGFRPFPLTSQFHFTIVLSRYLRIPSFCPWPINYDVPFDVINPPHIHYRFGLVENPFFFA